MMKLDGWLTAVIRLPAALWLFRRQPLTGYSTPFLTVQQEYFNYR